MGYMKEKWSVAHLADKLVVHLVVVMVAMKVSLTAE